MAKAQTIYTTRPVMSVYYRGEEVVKTTHSAYPNNAVCNAIRHMQTNEYDATHAEVYSGETGKLYAVIKWGIKEINILYRAKIDEYIKPSKEWKNATMGTFQTNTDNDDIPFSAGR